MLRSLSCSVLSSSSSCGIKSRSKVNEYCSPLSVSVSVSVRCALSLCAKVHTSAVSTSANASFCQSSSACTLRRVCSSSSVLSSLTSVSVSLPQSSALWLSSAALVGHCRNVYRCADALPTTRYFSAAAFAPSNNTEGNESVTSQSQSPPPLSTNDAVRIGKRRGKAAQFESVDDDQRADLRLNYMDKRERVSLSGEDGEDDEDSLLEEDESEKATASESDDTQVRLTKDEYNQLAVKARKRQQLQQKLEAFDRLSVTLRAEKEDRRRAEAAKSSPAAPTIEMPIDHQIQSAKVIVIDEDGKRLGVMEKHAAIEYAHDKGMKLMQVAGGNASGASKDKEKEKEKDKDKEKDKAKESTKDGKNVGAFPVCKVMDTGKFFYDRSKREREVRRRERSKEMKTVRLRTRTEANEAKFKVKQGIQFMNKGHTLRIAIVADNANTNNNAQNSDDENDNDDNESDEQQNWNAEQSEQQVAESGSKSSSVSSAILSPSAYFLDLSSKFCLADFASWDNNWAETLSSKGYVQLTPLTDKQKEKRKKDLEKKEKEDEKEKSKTATVLTQTPTHSQSQSQSQVQTQAQAAEQTVRRQGGALPTSPTTSTKQKRR